MPCIVRSSLTAEIVEGARRLCSLRTATTARSDIATATGRKATARTVLLEAATTLAAAAIAATTRSTRSPAEWLVLARTHAPLFDNKLVTPNDKWVCGDGGLVTRRGGKVDKRTALHDRQ